jgi:anti-sigma B factor antagonist
VLGLRVLRFTPKGMSLQVSIRESAEVTVLDLQGRATIGRGNDVLSSHLRRLIEGGARKVLLNLAGVTQVDSSSLSTIVRAFVSVSRQGGSLKLLHPRGSVKLVLETLQLLNAIPCYEDETQAIASFS